MQKHTAKGSNRALLERHWKDDHITSWATILWMTIIYWVFMKTAEHLKLGGRGSSDGTGAGIIAHITFLPVPLSVLKPIPILCFSNFSVNRSLWNLLKCGFLSCFPRDYDSVELEWSLRQREPLFVATQVIHFTPGTHSAWQWCECLLRVVQCTTCLAKCGSHH